VLVILLEVSLDYLRRFGAYWGSLGMLLGPLEAIGLPSLWLIGLVLKSFGAFLSRLAWS